MDPSNSLTFLLGNLRIAESEISAETWVQLFYDLLRPMKGRIKYADYFWELNRQLNDYGSSTNGYCRVTNMSTINMCEGVGPKTRFIQLNRTQVEACGGNPFHVHHEILFLDQKGDFFGFAGNYQKLPMENDHTILNLTDGYVVPIDVEDLMGMFGLDPKLPRRTLFTLYSSLESAVQRTASRLKEQESDLQNVTDVFRRIER